MIGLVCGGRNFGTEVICAQPAPAKKQITFFEKSLVHLHSIYSFSVIVSGGAKGADTLAIQWANLNGLELKVFMADWKRHGTGAGPVRNQRMIDEARPDITIAFAGGRGTLDMINRSYTNGVKVIDLREFYKDSSE